jgi:DNA-binding CsgD family transcriptional regulator
MVTVEDFSRLVAGIYAAAVSPRRWEGSLRDIQQAMDGTFATLLRADHAVWSVLDSTLPDAAIASYRAYYCHLDHVLAEVRQGPVGTLRTGSELIVPHSDSEFCSEWLRQNDIGDGVLVRLTGGANPQCFIVGSPPGTEAFDTPERVALLDGLIGHLQQALRTQAKLGALADTNLRLVDALEAIPHGLLLVAADCLVVELNSAAEAILRSADGLSMRAARITAASAQAARQLNYTVCKAVSIEPTGTRGGHSFECVRPSGKRPYVVHVIPTHHDGAPDGTPTALMLIVDPENYPEPSTVMLRRMYGLTETEAEVAQHLAHGAQPRTISDDLSISLTTVRTHIQHVFTKTGTHRQAELVRLLMLLSP